MKPDRQSELSKLVTIQFDLALAGNRPVFCQKCFRPFKARETTKFGDLYRTVMPYRHSASGGRDICLGSFDHAVLAPPPPK